MGSVILAATSLANQNGNFSPQHVNNWSIQIHGMSAGASGGILTGTDSLSFSLARGFLPVVGVDEGAIPFGNETVYYAGRARFEAGTIEIRDYVDQDTQGILTNWYAKVYGGVNGAWGLVGVPSSYKRPADILFSAPDGTSVRFWALGGVWPLQMNFGNLDMGSSEQVMVAISLRYDRAQYKGSDTSVQGQASITGALSSLAGAPVSV